MASSLPNNPSIDRLRDDARKLQRGVTASTSRAINIVRRYHPRPDVALANAPDRFALHDAQLTVARGYGFTGWPALVHYLEIAKAISFDPDTVAEDSLDSADRFCTLSSLYYSQSDAPPRRQAAADLLAADPRLVEQHVWAAAAAADQNALASHLAARPELATTRGVLSAGFRCCTCVLDAPRSTKPKTGYLPQQRCCSTRAPIRTRATSGAVCRPRSPR